MRDAAAGWLGLYTYCWIPKSRNPLQMVDTNDDPSRVTATAELAPFLTPCMLGTRRLRAGPNRSRGHDGLLK